MGDESPWSCPVHCPEDRGESEMCAANFCYPTISVTARISHFLEDRWASFVEFLPRNTLRLQASISSSNHQASTWNWCNNAFLLRINIGMGFQESIFLRSLAECLVCQSFSASSQVQWPAPADEIASYVLSAVSNWCFAPKGNFLHVTAPSTVRNRVCQPDSHALTCCLLLHYQIYFFYTWSDIWLLYYLRVLVSSSEYFLINIWG